MTYGWCSSTEEKLHFTPVHTLCQLKRDEGLFPPLPISLADRNGLKNLPRQIFSACVKFGGNLCRDVETLGFTPVLTCSNLFTPVHTSVMMYAHHAISVFPSIFPFRKLLFFSLTCYPAEIAYFNSPNRQLSNGGRVNGAVLK